MLRYLKAVEGRVVCETTTLFCEDLVGIEHGGKAVQTDEYDQRR